MKALLLKKNKVEKKLKDIEKEIFLKRHSTKPLKKQTPLKVIDLFCGAGGMTLGFSQHFGHPFIPVWANDFNKHCVSTYNLNFGNHCHYGDIVSILENTETRIPKADVVIGGPPCQGFSMLNKKRTNDPRRELWRPYLDIVEKSSASIFVIENVPALLGTPEHEEIVKAAKKMGFYVWSGKMCAADFGVPQARWRAIIVGAKNIDPAEIFPLRKTHYNTIDALRLSGKSKEPKDEFMPNPQPWRTVRQAIGDLPKPQGTEIRKTAAPLDLHFGRTPTPLSLKRYKSIPKEGMNRFDLQRRAPELTPQCWLNKPSGGTDLFGRLWWDKPAVTMRTEFFKPEKGRYLHPVENRPITHREAARFQSFPDTFLFAGSKIEIAKQIGNAVPPLFAARIADAVLAIATAQKNG